MVERRRRQNRPDVATAQGTRTVRSRREKAGQEIDGSEVEDQETEIHKFTTDPAYVRVNAGVTKNMGSYESLRIDVSVSMPCYKEQVDRTYEELSERVYKMLDEELKKYDVS